jgi:hypothetical protein
MNRPQFTNEQRDYICYMIGEWYLDWKYRIADYKTHTHSLGYAKEKLKDMLFPLTEENE